MAKLDKDLRVRAFDPATRILLNYPAKADKYPVGSIVMYDEADGLVKHVDGALEGVVVGRVMYHQDVKEDGYGLECQRGLHVMEVDGFTTPNEPIYFTDSLVAVADDTDAIIGGRYIGPVTGAGENMAMVDIGSAPKPSSGGDNG